MDTEIYAYTDGAASNNGKPNATASWGYVIQLVDTSFPPKVMSTLYEDSGKVESKTYKLENMKIVPSNKKINPSNNRGEYLGFCHSLLKLIELFTDNKIKGRPPIAVISDSLLCIKTMEEWLPNRKNKGTEHELKNPDLLKLTDQLLVQLRTITNVRLQHVRSHQNEPIEHNTINHIIWKGNDIADKLATLAQK